MKILWVIVIGLFIAGCNQRTAGQVNKKEQVVKEIQKKTSNQLALAKDLIPCGTCGRMMDQIKLLGLTFFYRHPVDVEQGRRLLITAVQTLIANVNANEQVRPYLNNFPFESKNVELIIHLQRPDGSRFGAGELCVLQAEEGKIEYLIQDSKGALTAIYQETYEEALQKIAQLDDTVNRENA